MTFWDKFSKVCSWLYLPWLVLLLIWPDMREVFVGWANTDLGFTLLMLLVIVGNFVPGIPTNPAPILLGLVFAAQANYSAADPIILMSIFCLIGSLVAYVWGNNRIPNFIHKSDGFRKAKNDVWNAPSLPLLIFTSRFYKSGRLGYVNYIAGDSRGTIDKLSSDMIFSIFAFTGHVIWVFLYFISAYGIQKLLG